jgi:DNA excision repair protein ERCC-5
MGVRRLWDLLEPFATPTTPDRWRGKRVAIDASIWIEQFRRVAPVMASPSDEVQLVLEGFLRRLLRLLFFGILPVLVFDGPAPVIKRAEQHRRAVARAARAEQALRQRLERLVTQQLASGDLGVAGMSVADAASLVHAAALGRQAEARSEHMAGSFATAEAAISASRRRPRHPNETPERPLRRTVAARMLPSPGDEGKQVAVPGPPGATANPQEREGRVRTRQQFFESAASIHESSETADELGRAAARRRGAIVRRLARLKASDNAAAAIAAGNRLRSATSFLGPMSVIEGRMQRADPSAGMEGHAADATERSTAAAGAVRAKTKRLRANTSASGSSVRALKGDGVVVDYATREGADDAAAWASADAEALSVLQSLSAAVASSTSLVRLSRATSGASLAAPSSSVHVIVSDAEDSNKEDGKDMETRISAASANRTAVGRRESIVAPWEVNSTSSTVTSFDHESSSDVEDSVNLERESSFDSSVAADQYLEVLGLTNEEDSSDPDAEVVDAGDDTQVQYEATATDSSVVPVTPPSRAAAPRAAVLVISDSEPPNATPEFTDRVQLSPVVTPRPRKFNVDLTSGSPPTATPQRFPASPDVALSSHFPSTLEDVMRVATAAASQTARRPTLAGTSGGRVYGGSVPLHLVEVVELLDALGVPYVMSPSEADATCGFLSAAGVVDAVMTEDSDVFLFGARHVLRGFFATTTSATGGSTGGSADPFSVSHHDMTKLDAVGLSRCVLIAMAMLMGSDYTPGVVGFSIPRAVETVAAFDTCHRDPLERCLGSLTRFKAAVLCDPPGTARGSVCRPTHDDEVLQAAYDRCALASRFVRHAVRTQPSIGHMHSTARRDALAVRLFPPDFPDPRIMEAYLAAPVVDPTSLDLGYKPGAGTAGETDADWAKVRDIAEVRCGWSQQELVQRIDKVRAAQLQRQDEADRQAELRRTAAGPGQSSITDAFARRAAVTAASTATAATAAGFSTAYSALDPGSCASDSTPAVRANVLGAADFHNYHSLRESVQYFVRRWSGAIRSAASPS